MKRIISVFLLVQMLFQLTGGLRVSINHEIFSDYIAKVLCVNKNTEDNDCQGQCHKRQALKEESEKEKKQDNVKEEIAIHYLVIANTDFAQKVENLSEETFKPYRRNYSYTYGDKGFHPPCPAV